MAKRERPFLRVVSEADAAGAVADAGARAAAFEPPFLAPWLRACRKLEGAGYGPTVVKAYEIASPEIAGKVGPEPAIELADVVSAVTIKSGRRAGEAMSEAARDVARRYAGDPRRYRAWASLMQRFAAMAPESVTAVLERTPVLLGVLNVSALEAWLLAGVRDAGGDRERRHAFFMLATPDAERWLAREAGEVVFADQERRLKAWLTALFGVRVPVREPPPGLPEASRRRPGFAEGLIRMPPTFPGYRGGEAEDVFKAALAHIGAHYRFTRKRFPVGQLKPVQIAVVSLVEDARVEALAMRAFPGLARLWLPFHIAEAGGARTAPSLFARLSRALIDPDFHDPDGWVRKGRDLFRAAVEAGRLEDPAISREIGNVLGNDIGQMRIQFNAKTYVVEPPYRDDNLGLWDMPDQTDAVEETEVIVESVSFREPDENRPETPDREREEEAEEPGEVERRARPVEADADEGVPVARYAEYDYATGRERPEWTTVREYRPPPGDPAAAERLLDRHADLVERLTRLIKAARVSRPQRLKRQVEGEALDLDAVLEAAIDRRSGHDPDPRVYQTMARRHRDLSVLVLIDASQSTADRVKGHVVSVLDVEREATLLLSHALSGLGDPFAIAAFSSNRRDDVRYTRIKDFGEPYGVPARSALMGLSPGYSTRLGAALRHAGADLARQLTHRRLVLVVSDGEPSDLDCQDPRYLVEDARRAVQTLAARGIDVFCVGLDAGGDDYLHPIFGRRNVTVIDRSEQLPARLPLLYMRLTS